MAAPSYSGSGSFSGTGKYLLVVLLLQATVIHQLGVMHQVMTVNHSCDVNVENIFNKRTKVIFDKSVDQPSFKFVCGRVLKIQTKTSFEH